MTPDLRRENKPLKLKRAFSARSQANAAILEATREVRAESDGTYGAPRVRAELAGRGPRASLNRAARVMP